ncbi:hypothetical protein [Candidatus Endowatersipora endosymbiont of Watersipora subatra]|uniref:hypothetical protein n=1 Tax=Candidatus Endowatersipora endosymbiont of Watersipora subatra TaxID=3077946 RepID=UPI00312C7B53
MANNSKTIGDKKVNHQSIAVLMTIAILWGIAFGVQMRTKSDASQDSILFSNLSL